MQRTIRVFVLLAGSVSGACGDATRGDVAVPPTVLPEEPGVDHGSGVDDQDGSERGLAQSFASCAQDADCPRGSCFKELKACFTLCAAPVGVPLSGFEVEPCARTEQCVRATPSAAGFCAIRCTTTRDCQDAYPTVKMRCQRIGGRAVCTPFDAREGPQG